MFSEPAHVFMEQKAPGQVEFILVARHAPPRIAARLEFASAYHFINVPGRAQRLRRLDIPTRRFPQKDGTESFGPLPTLHNWKLRERAAGELLIWHHMPWIVGNKRYSSHTDIFVEDVPLSIRAGTVLSIAGILVLRSLVACLTRVTNCLAVQYICRGR